MANFYKAPTSNYWSSTTNGAVDAAVQTITSTSTVGLQAPGVIVIDREDGNGTATPNSREIVSYTGISGNDLTGCTRGAESSTARSHGTGALVEAVFTVTQWNDLRDAVAASLTTNGTGIALSGTASIAQINGTGIVLSGTASIAQINGTGIALSGTASIAQIKLGTGGINLNAPEGFPINGKIVPSVTSNNLTVAIKGMDGNDPSATNPVYVRIGDTVRSITAALSVTKNAATNWCNSGGAELATKEIDYFVYLGYNATDGVVLGFSRIPYGTLYSSFSATTTAETYCAISTISTAAAGDNYVNIGRFAGTLSAGAGYTWSVPTFTSANLIQRPIYETRLLSWVPVITAGAGTPTTVTKTANQYKITGSKLEFYADNAVADKGTASATFLATLPFTTVNVGIVSFSARETYRTGQLIGLKIVDNYYSAMDYLNATLWINTNQLTIGGFYEI